MKIETPDPMISGTTGLPSLKEQVVLHPLSRVTSTTTPSRRPTVTGWGSVASRPRRPVSQVARSWGVTPMPGSARSS